jgi:ribosome-associated protein
MSKNKEKMSQTQLLKTINTVLADKKAEDLISLNVHDLTSVTDTMIIASGTSHTHLRAMMQALVEVLKKSDVQLLGVEGEQNGEWILVDAGSVLIHLMLPQVRSYYELEKLWSVHPNE